MNNEDIDRRIDRLAERQQALSESVELLSGSVRDLTAVVHAMVADTQERRERDKQYFAALAGLFKSWAGNGANT